jgi:hypothetical protein
VKAFDERGFNVVANSRKVTQSSEVAASDHVALVDGHIGEPATAATGACLPVDGGRTVYAAGS